MNDKTGPTVSITVPANASSFIVGQQVAVRYSCADGLSGVDTCAGPVASGSNIDTASAGPKAFLVNAMDKTGNPASLSVSYSVVEPGPRTLSALDPAKVWVGLIMPRGMLSGSLGRAPRRWRSRSPRRPRPDRRAACRPRTEMIMMARPYFGESPERRERRIGMMPPASGLE